MLKQPKNFVSENSEITKVQTNLVEFSNTIIKKEILDGILLENISLSTGSNQIEHKLGRTPRGYISTKQDNSLLVNSVSFDDKFIYLNCELKHDPVIAVYWVEGSTSANTSIAAGATEIIDYQNKVYDTHNAVTTGAAWKFTAPYDGYYRVSYSIPLDASAADATGEGRLFANGTLFSRGFEIHYNTANWLVGHGGSIVYLSAGQYLDIRASNNDIAAINVNGSNTTKESVTIEKISDYSDVTNSVVSLWVF